MFLLICKPGLPWHSIGISANTYSSPGWRLNMLKIMQANLLSAGRNKKILAIFITSHYFQRRKPFLILCCINMATPHFCSITKAFHCKLYFLNALYIACFIIYETKPFYWNILRWFIANKHMTKSYFLNKKS